MAIQEPPVCPQSQVFVIKGELTPILPHTIESSTAYINNPCARLAWVIPVRGGSPWDGATAASLLASGVGSDTPETPEYPSALHESSSHDIVWTRAALLAFWDFLHSARATGNFGPVTLSFEALPPPLVQTSTEQGSYNIAGSHKLTTPSASLHPPANDPSGGSISSHPLLRNTDHIKIFHDGRYTQAIRNILHFWSFRCDERKISLLKGAKLALLDERSHGILLL